MLPDEMQNDAVRTNILFDRCFSTNSSSAPKPTLIIYEIIFKVLVIYTKQLKFSYTFK